MPCEYMFSARTAMSTFPVRSPLPKSVPSMRSAPGKERELRRRDAGTPVVVRVDADNGGLSRRQVLCEIFLSGPANWLGRQHSTVEGRFNMTGFSGVAPRACKTASQTLTALSISVAEKLSGEYSNLMSIPDASASRLSSRMILGGVLRDLHDAVNVGAEDHAALQLGGRVIEVKDDVLCALNGLECPENEVLARLHVDLDRHIVGDEVPVDERAHSVEFGLGGGGEADLYLLEAHIGERFEKAQFFTHIHGADECLIPVAQVNAAPYGRFFYNIFGPAAPVHLLRYKRDIFRRIQSKSLLSGLKKPFN